VKTTRTNENSGDINEFDDAEGGPGSDSSGGSAGSGLAGEGSADDTGVSVVGFKRRTHDWKDASGKSVFQHVKWRADRWAYRHKVAKADRTPHGTCPEHEAAGALGCQPWPIT
jgi:hypothetical protein